MRYDAFRSTVRVIPCMYRSAPVDFVILIGLSVVGGLAPAVWVYTTRLVIDTLAVGGTPDLAALQPVLAAWVVSFLFQRVTVPIIQNNQANLAEKFTAYINLQIIGKSEALKGIAHFDREDYYNTVKLIEEGARSRPMNVVSVLFFMIRDAITIASISLTLAGLAWWVPVLLFLGLYPGILAALRFRELSWKALLGRSTQARQMEYCTILAANMAFSLEARVYRTFPWVRRRYATLFAETHAAMRTVRREATLGIVPVELFSIACIALLLYWSVQSIVTGQMMIGSIASLLQAYALGQAALAGIIESVGIIFERGLFFKLFFEFLALPDCVRHGAEPAPEPERICFSKVSFVYPNGVAALRDVSFDIRRGERIAIVGANGSGKSTLVKLLLRLYDPSGGRIEADGRDVRDIDIDGWRRLFGVVPQDVQRYALTLRETIHLSDTERFEPADDVFLRALDSAALGTLARDVGTGLDQPLGREFNGRELSGGQWQKLSIARAVFRNPPLLILDEPSAALDPESEAQFLANLHSLSRDKTALFVTHRLGAIRLADRILVLRDGRLVESGTHDDLLSRGGEYAMLWRAQVDQYATPPWDTVNSLAAVKGRARFDQERAKSGGVRGQGRVGHLGPGGECLGSGDTILGSGVMIAAEVDEVIDQVVDGQEALNLPG